MKAVTLLSVGLGLVLCGLSTRAGDIVVSSRDARVEPLILELKLQSGPELRQEILVVEDRSFWLKTHREDERWLVEGKVGPIVNGTTNVDLKVRMHGPHPGSSAHLGPVKLKLKVDEFSGSGFGSNQASNSDFWIRRGANPIPALMNQLGGRPDKALPAFDFLKQL